MIHSQKQGEILLRNLKWGRLLVQSRKKGEGGGGFGCWSKIERRGEIVGLKSTAVEIVGLKSKVREIVGQKSKMGGDCWLKVESRGVRSNVMILQDWHDCWNRARRTHVVTGLFEFIQHLVDLCKNGTPKGFVEEIIENKKEHFQNQFHQISQDFRSISANVIDRKYENMKQSLRQPVLIYNILFSEKNSS